jgi:hypothetical protein
MNKLEGYERGSLAPVIKCARCNEQARLIVENGYMAGLESPTLAVCVEHAVAIANELGDSLGAQLIAERMRAI